MSTTPTKQGQSTSTTESHDPIIRRINDRFVSIQTGSEFKVVFSPLHPGIKLFDDPPPAPTGKPASVAPVTIDKPATVAPVNSNKPASVPPVSTSKPASVASVTIDKPATVGPVNSDKPASVPAVSTNKPASVAPVSVDKPASVAPINSDKPASVAPVSTNTPASGDQPAPSLGDLPEILPPEDDVANGHFVQVYGYPKAYPDIDYSQGDAVPGYMGTCGETSIANLLTMAGQKVTEGDVVKKAIDNQWCNTTCSNPSGRGGTTRIQQQKLLASYGVATGVLNDYDPDKFAKLIKQGRGVLLGVNGAELWGADLSPEQLNLINVNHMITLNGVAYSSSTGNLLGFYIADSARGFAFDAARFISLPELEKVAHFSTGCDVIYTIDPIKRPSSVVAPPAPAAFKPVYTELNNQEIATYGNPQANTQLDFSQGNALSGYEGTSGEVCVANIAMLAGMTVSEKDVLQKAIEQKLCDTTSTSSALRGSTTALQQVALLKDFGISATVSDNFDVASVAKSIKEGKGVIVSVDRTLLEKNSAPVEPGYVAHADQSIVITGVSYSAVTNDVDAFYISDSGRGLSGDRSRYITARGMRRITDAIGVTTITTTEAIRLRTPALSGADVGGDAGKLPAKPASVDKPASVAPANSDKPASVAPVSPSKPASVAPVTINKPATVAPVNSDKPASAPPVSPSKPASVAPASAAPVSADKPADSPTPAVAGILPAEHDKIDGKDVLVYGYPKSYNMLNYSQGFAVKGYLGTCTEASEANLLTIAGQEVSEADVIKRAIVNGWCDSTSKNPALRGGAMTGQQRDLLKSYGVNTGVLNDFDAEKLATLVKQGKGVIIGVNAEDLWGKPLPAEVRAWVNIDHVVNLAGVAYAADTGALLGFYIADTGRGRPEDQARYLTVSELYKAAHFEFGCNAIYTLDPIKKAKLPDTGPADPSKPKMVKEYGDKLIIYGDPKAYHNLDYDQPVVMPMYTETSGEIAVANIAALAGQSLSPKTVLQTAIDEKLCDTTKKDRDLGGGTTSENQVALLKKFGIAATLEQGFDENAVARHIIEGKGVILRVNGGVVWARTEPDNPGRSDYSVTVTGVAFSADTGEVAGFYLADPGSERSAAAPSYIGIDQLRRAASVTGATTITTNDAIKPHSPPPGSISLDPVNASALTAAAKPPGTASDSPIALPNAQRYLEAFNAPAPFGDDDGPLKKLPGVTARKTLVMEGSAKELTISDDHLNGIGNVLDNRITGNDRDNILDGMAGADTMIGGKGDDSYYVDNVGDKVIEKAGEGVDTVYATVNTTLSANVENLVLLDATKPQTAVVNGVHALVYGRPRSYQLDYTQGDAVKGYRGTCSETTIANITTMGDRPATEKEVVEKAIKEKWCDTLTPLDDFRGAATPEQQQALLKAFGFAARVTKGYDEKAIVQSIKEGKGVAVSVSAGNLWGMGGADQDYCDHIVTVTGVACSAMTGETIGFYIADSGQGRASDMCRFVSSEQLCYAANVTGAHTMTTDAPIKLRNQNLDATGNELDNILVGNHGDNAITGGKGNDLLIGGAGNDTYSFAKGDGQDTLYDHDATKDNLDTLTFTDAKQTNLWFSKAGDDLKIAVLGSKDEVTVKDWYVGGDSGRDNHIERIKTADGKTLYDTDVEQLVQAMASFAPPSATQTSWKDGQSSNGKVLLTVTH
ncbi:Ca2+-binding RTX toxin-like protein [Herbaspirillum seropedicae]|uniref:C39 family peptidase n=1 Tax=Herbaspirillum seropedicae TaxID=964 RepID=UPI00339B4C30